jgi:glycopeptide antibiotics resistance protein
MIMALKDRMWMYFSFLAVYVLLGVFNVARHSEWVIDSCISVVFVTALFFLSNWARIGKREFILFNAALLLHNLGSFGFYSWNDGLLAFDNLVHLVSAGVSAFIVFHFLQERLCLRLSLDGKNKRDTKAILILLVFSVVMLLGVFIELMEFSGVMLFSIDGDSVGLLGVGDQNAYLDTMTDIIMNIVGCVIGTAIYYLSSFKKSSG